MSVLPPFLLFGRNPEVLVIPLPSENRKNLLKTSSGCFQSLVLRYEASSRSSVGTEAVSEAPRVVGLSGNPLPRRCTLRLSECGALPRTDAHADGNHDFGPSQEKSPAIIHSSRSEE